MKHSRLGSKFLRSITEMSQKEHKKPETFA